MSTTATFEQRATAAGASLRAAFYEGDSMTAPTTHRPPSLEQPTGSRFRGRTLLAAAAAVVAITAGAAVVLDNGDDESALPPAQDPQPTEAAVVTGLLGVPGYPLRITVPDGLAEVDEDPGSRAFRPVDGIDGGIVMSGLRSVDGTSAWTLPADVTTLLRARSDLDVSDVGTRTIAGRQGQSFTLNVRDGATAADVWCPIAGPACFKPLAGKAMDVVVLPTATEPLWIAVEYAPGAEAAVSTLADALFAGMELLTGSTATVQGASLVLPSTWKVSARTDRYLQAGNPTNRDTEGVNIIVPSAVQQPDGTRIDTPADAAAWLASRAGLEVSDLGSVQVDGRPGRLLLTVPTGPQQTLWCGTTETASCFNTGPEGALYAVVPYGDETLVVEVLAMTGTDPQAWAQSTRELLTGVELP